MSTEIREQLHGQMGAENTGSLNSSKELITKTPIIGTPFTAISDGKTKHIVLGAYRINKEGLALDEDENNWLEQNNWNVLMTMIIAIIETERKQKMAKEGHPEDKFYFEKK